MPYSMWALKMLAIKQLAAGVTSISSACGAAAKQEIFKNIKPFASKIITVSKRVICATGATASLDQPPASYGGPYLQCVGISQNISKRRCNITFENSMHPILQTGNELKIPFERSKSLPKMQRLLYEIYLRHLIHM